MLCIAPEHIGRCKQVQCLTLRSSKKTAIGLFKCRRQTVPKRNIVFYSNNIIPRHTNTSPFWQDPEGLSNVHMCTCASSLWGRMHCKKSIRYIALGTQVLVSHVGFPLHSQTQEIQISRSAHIPRTFRHNNLLSVQSYKPRARGCTRTCHMRDFIPLLLLSRFRSLTDWLVRRTSVGNVRELSSPLSAFLGISAAQMTT